jgi:hypothetical protein
MEGEGETQMGNEWRNSCENKRICQQDQSRSTASGAPVENQPTGEEVNVLS